MSWLGMLTIRDEQWHVFEATAESAFTSRVVAHLQRALPLVCAQMGEGEVRRSVERGVRKARAYRISSEYDVVRFIDLLFVLGSEFDTALQWAHDILNDTRVPADMRLKMIDEYLDQSRTPAREAEDG